MKGVSCPAQSRVEAHRREFPSSWLYQPGQKFWLHSWETPGLKPGIWWPVVYVGWVLGVCCTEYSAWGQGLCGSPANQKWAIPGLVYVGGHKDTHAGPRQVLSMGCSWSCWILQRKGKFLWAVLLTFERVIFKAINLVRWIIKVAHSNTFALQPAPCCPAHTHGNQRPPPWQGTRMEPGSWRVMTTLKA